MKQITQIGASVDEALHLALQKLGVTRQQVEVEVLQEGKKGFLGFGAKQAEIRVTLKEEQEQSNTPNVEATEVIELVENLANASDLKEDKEFQQVEGNDNNELLEDVNVIQNVDPIEKAKEYVTNIAREMGIQDLKIEVENKGKRLLFKLDSEKAALLIGKHGATLNALQQLTQLVVNNTAKTFISVTLDVENYRDRRQATLEQLADRMADKAVRTGRKVVLEPMPSYERKVIHNALANRIDIETYSEGTEPNRYLVIEPLK
ncbi:protein jag [Ureibacillus massiliensis 4400831 = CIP 108448 = CCUG 49529]|uniref:RNA-binding protein KhpB n=1 Tax=Ureibacillus massiliensis 4400831 = CIP 108448 = CCUG 49529 TaxID=1211035 RepID=A0A0A3J4B5_9BACL|nr:RNA-binding cell elongation regulator Jag/EloR [Ureibacillus massiliensis]KGR91849.1 protein jag [Ureibacillus massiliensis 4400831 = CIP 108448 = CCUG 49529]BDH63812.1 RNA-binding protein Jag [Lysinibacillus sp. PLM2]